MIELTILNYLNNTLDVPCFMERPEECEKFVLIEKTSSGEENYISTAMFAIQSYAGTLYDAACLNERVKTAMKQSIELDCISRCKLNNDYNYTDTTRKEYRYQAVFDLVYFD